MVPAGRQSLFLYHLFLNFIFFIKLFESVKFRHQENHIQGSLNWTGIMVLLFFLKYFPAKCAISSVRSQRSNIRWRHRLDGWFIDLDSLQSAANFKRMCYEFDSAFLISIVFCWVRWIEWTSGSDNDEWFLSHERNFSVAYCYFALSTEQPGSRTIALPTELPTAKVL